MKEVTEYSIERNVWKIHSQLSEAVHGASGVVLDDILYKLGGYPSAQHTVLWCGLKGLPLWNPINVTD